MTNIPTERAMKTKAGILAFLKANQGWILQHCKSVSKGGWWWVVRKDEGTGATLCHTNAAAAAARSLKPIRWERDWPGDQSYEA